MGKAGCVRIYGNKVGTSSITEMTTADLVSWTSSIPTLNEYLQQTNAELYEKYTTLSPISMQCVERTYSTALMDILSAKFEVDSHVITMLLFKSKHKMNEALMQLKYAVLESSLAVLKHELDTLVASLDKDIRETVETHLRLTLLV